MEQLTIGEIEQLLKAISDDEPVDNSKKIRRIDFSRLDKFSLKELEQIGNVSEKFCCEFSTQDFSMHLSSIDQLTFKDFCRCIPAPTTLIQSFYGNSGIIIEIDPLMTFSLLKLRTENHQNRCLSSEEFQKLKTQFLDNLITSFTSRIEEDFQLKKAELKEIKYTSTSDLLETDYPDDIGCLITYECKLNNDEGMIIFFIPWRTAKNYLHGKFRSEKNKIEFSDIFDSKAKIDVLFGTANLSPSQIEEIKQEGKLVSLKETIPSEPLLRINSKPVARVNITSNENKIHIKIEELLDQNTQSKKTKVITKNISGHYLEAILEITSMPLSKALEINTSTIFEIEDTKDSVVTVNVEGIGQFKAELLSIDDNYGLRMLENLPELEDKESAN